MDIPAIRMQNITKTFPGVLANDQINLDIFPGEIHCLLGENGSGKTTLMNIIYGISRPDSGEIYVDGRQVTLDSPGDAIKQNIGMVHQHFMLVPIFTVTQNIVLGEKGKREPFLDLHGAKERILEISRKTGLKVHPDARISQLGVGDQQRVEIIKALYKGARVLILDEPTSVLTPGETRELFSAIKTMADNGMAVILITHKLEEVMSISDRVTVLRRGKKVYSALTGETGKNELARQMVGHEVSFSSDKKPVKSGHTVLDIHRITVKGNRGINALDDLSLHVCQGEILGVAGVSGNGQDELVETILGMRTQDKGSISIKGQDIKNRSTRQIINLGVSCIPFERQHSGLVLSLPLKESMILKNWYREPFTKFHFLQPKEITNFAQKLIGEYDIMTPSPESKVSILSGGNQQKVVIAREFSSQPDLILACNPTNGLDIGASDYVWKQLLKARQRGAAILLISTELEEILALSDRVAVIFSGSIRGEVEAKRERIEEIGLLMAGANQTGEVILHG